MKHFQWVHAVPSVVDSVSEMRDAGWMGWDLGMESESSSIPSCKYPAYLTPPAYKIADPAYITVFSELYTVLYVHGTHLKRNYNIEILIKICKF